MNVIGHEHIGVDIAAMGLGGGCQKFEIALVIRLGEKRSLTIIPTLNYMLRNIGEAEARQSRHGALMCGVRDNAPKQPSLDKQP